MSDWTGEEGGDAIRGIKVVVEKLRAQRSKKTVSNGLTIILELVITYFLTHFSASRPSPPSNTQTGSNNTYIA